MAPSVPAKGEATPPCPADVFAGAPEEEIFADEDEQPEAEAPSEEPKRLPKPKPRPFPLPGATMQPPPPEGAKG